MSEPAPIKRRHARRVDLADIQVGGGAPVVVQSRTNTYTADPNGDRVKEVIVAQELLQTMGLRSFVDRQTTVTLKGTRFGEDFQRIVDDYVRATYGGEARAAHLSPATTTITVKAVA